MNNYDEIAKEAIKNITGLYFPSTDIDNLYHDALLYEVAHEAARLQAERFNKDLDASYIKYLESKEDLN